MLRGVLVDLETSRDTLARLLPAYERDLRARDLTNETLGMINTILRACEGSLGKVADGTHRKFGTTKRGPYYPIVSKPGDFPRMFDGQLPGLARAHPAVRDAFERHQPYQPGKQVLDLLKPLYRENHHHDYTVQEIRGWQSWPIVLYTDPDAPPPPSPPPGELLVHLDWNGLHVEEGTVANAYIDWYFADLRQQVLPTLSGLHNVCVYACEDISSVAGL